MDDRTLENLCVKFDHAVTLFDDKTVGVQQMEENPDQYSGQYNENSDLLDTSGASEDSEEMSSYQGQTLPIFEKVEVLGDKIQGIKKDHTILCNEVKSITVDSLLGPEAFTAIQILSTEHELLKKKHEDCEIVKKKHHEDFEVLKKKYLAESSQRKNLYNEVIELKGNIRVFCRSRPLKEEEIASGSTSVVDFDSSQDNELHIISSDASKKQFKFDHVFRPEDNQDAIFAQTLPLVTSVLDGYNVCIFAYGQTGTGKTYTMEGTPENRGVNYRTLEELFRLSDEMKGVVKYELSVSMLEVYNEKIRDLLVENSNQNTKKLEIKQSAEGTQEVPGLVEARVHGTDEVWALLTSGGRARAVGSTNANEASSRSHCLLRVTVVAESLVGGQRTKSHLWLVDLAGSERVGRIEVEGDRLKESQFINKSLSALGDVISALASKTSHIPYRNSKLTHLLQSSLGGDCKTLMFVQISPNTTDLGETLCSLNFASRVRGVEHGPARKQTDHAELFKYKQLAEKAKHDEKELKKAQDSLQTLQVRLYAKDQNCRNLQEKVRDLENQLAEERKTRMKQENRALSSIPSSSNLVQKTTVVEKKPPLAPSRFSRLPLQKITNYMPPVVPQPPIPSNKKRTSFLPRIDENRQNNALRLSENTRKPMEAKRYSFVPTRSTTSQSQLPQPKRRFSAASFVSASSSNAKPTFGVARKRSNIWEPLRLIRTQSSPVQPSWKFSTPLGPKSSKFGGTPKHPSAVALQMKKNFVWSPMRIRGMKERK